MDVVTIKFAGLLQCEDVDVLQSSKLALSFKKTRHFLSTAGSCVLRLFLCVHCLPAATYCAPLGMTSQYGCHEHGPIGKGNKIDPASAFLGTWNCPLNARVQLWISLGWSFYSRNLGNKWSAIKAKIKVRPNATHYLELNTVRHLLVRWLIDSAVRQKTHFKLVSDGQHYFANLGISASILL